jgi:hypothetical protein
MSIESLKGKFDVDWDKCSVGEPVGEGLLVGYEGWGEPHVLLNPADPLDAQLDRLGLFGQFREVRSTGLLHMLHGDCTLTHAVTGMSSLLRPGGTLRIECLSLSEILRLAICRLDRGDFVTSQTLEKTCFLQPVDNSKLLYPQTLISNKKLHMMLFDSGLTEVRNEKEVDIAGMEFPLLPDSIRLGEVENEVWEASSANFRMEEGLGVDRPTCLLCERVVTKRDHDRRYFSRYCKDHYHQGRIICDRKLREAFTIAVVATKGNSNATKN